MLNIFTIVLDGMPFIQRHLPVFEELNCSYRWHVVEGVALNTHDTAWCKRIPARLSTDGTHEYLMSIQDHPNVTVSYAESWENKTVMCNHALAQMTTNGVLFQMDSDEVHSKEGIESIVQCFKDFPEVGSIRIDARFYVGPDLITVGHDCWGCHERDWLRAFRFSPGQTFERHESPTGPVLLGNTGYCMTREESRRAGAIMDHYAYATEAQVAFKERYYNYRGATAMWKRLQRQTTFPVPLRDYFSWCNDDTLVYRIDCCAMGCLSLGFDHCKGMEYAEHPEREHFVFLDE